MSWKQFVIGLLIVSVSSPGCYSAQNAGMVDSDSQASDSSVYGETNTDDSDTISDTTKPTDFVSDTEVETESTDTHTDTESETDSFFDTETVFPCGDESPCHPAANCTIDDTDVRCECKVGYFGDGYYCQDINECYEAVDNCDEGLFCLNVNSTYSCVDDCGPSLDAFFPSLDPTDVAVLGGYSFLLSRNDLLIFDASDSGHVQYLARVTLPPNHTYREIAYVDEQWLVVIGDILAMVDISTPAASKVVTKRTFYQDEVINTQFEDVHSALVFDDTILVSLGWNGLLVLDRTDLSLRTISSFHVPGKAWIYLRSFGAYMYAYAVELADDSASIRYLDLFDMSNPASPVLLKSFSPDDPYPAPRYIDEKRQLLYAVEKDLLGVFDVSDVFNPTMLSVVDLPQGNQVSFAVSEHLAFSASWTSLYVVDLTDPANPSDVVQMNLNMPGEIQDSRKIAVSNGVVHWAMSSLYRTALFDEPTMNAEEASRLFWFNDAFSVAAKDNHVFVADGENGLLVLQHNGEGDLGIVAALDNLGTRLIAVERVGDYLLGIDQDFDNQSCRLLTINISDPTTPVLVNAVEPDSLLYFLDVQGDRAYVAAGTDGVMVFDISDTESPNLLHTVTVQDDLSPLPVYDVKAHGDYIYAAAWSALATIDVSDGSDLSVVSVIPLSRAYRLDAEDNLLAAAQQKYGFSAGGFSLFDLQTPTEPALAGTYGDTWGGDVVVNDGFVYVPTIQNGVMVYDANDPYYVAKKGSIGDIRTPNGFVLQDGVLHVVSDEGYMAVTASAAAHPYVASVFSAASIEEFVTLDDYLFSDYHTVDISSPIYPALLAEDTTEYQYSDAITVHDGHLFRMAEVQGLVIDKINDDGHLVSVHHPTGSATRADADWLLGVGHRLFGCGYNACWWWDISNMSQPGSPNDWRMGEDLRFFRYPPAANNDYLFGEYSTSMSSFMPGAEGGLMVVDPLATGGPEVLSTLPWGSYASGPVSIFNDYLFASENNEVLIFDTINPASPAFVGRIPTRDTYGTNTRVTGTGNTVYVAYNRTISAWDISVASAPIHLADYAVPFYIESVTFKDGWLLVSTRDGALIVIEPDACM